MGVMVGEVDATSALVQFRCCATDGAVPNRADDAVTATDVPGTWGVVEFAVEPFDSEGDRPPPQTVPALPDRDFIARGHFTGLRPGTRYRVTVRFGATAPDRDGPTATFRTLPAADEPATFSMVVVTGMNYAKFHGDDRIDREQHRVENNTDLPEPYAGDDKDQGYPALETIRRLSPDAFVGTGDNVYYDTPDSPRAQTIAQMRTKWHQQFVQPRFKRLFASVPTYWEIDDHDYRIDDGDNSGYYRPLPEEGRRIAMEQLPYAPADAPAALTYRTHRAGRDLQFWLTENRFHRDPNDAPETEAKSIWGERQREWLRRTIRDSDATFKVLISPTPMVGPDDLRKTDNHCDVGGFRPERDAFFDFLKSEGLDGNFYLVCGDRHWQYHAVHPSGLEEFSCGALVDANSRLARMPGDPAGTDPDSTIRHLHVQDEPSGGFLWIGVDRGDDGPALTFRFHDERGVVLYETTKRVSRR